MEGKSVFGNFLKFEDILKVKSEKKKFVVAGIVTSVEYQKCKFYAQKLFKSFGDEYDVPLLMPMLNVEWNDFFWEIRRTLGGKTWTLEKNAVVLLNGEFLGDDVAMFNYATNKARIRVVQDFHCLGILELRDIFDRAFKDNRKFAYFTIALEGKSIGTLLFLLYADYVPKTVKHFLSRCKSEKRGWVGRPIHRLVKGSWLQLGGFDLENRKKPCENYIIPHDRRGVLSTCNEGKHLNNTTQLIISLNPTPWMDYKFVAFGQLIQGDEILKKIESIETNYESPIKSITILKCGEFTLDTTPDPVTNAEVKVHLERLNPLTGMPQDVEDPRDVSSELSVRNYQKGLYCLDMDLHPHPALNKWNIYYDEDFTGEDDYVKSVEDDKREVIGEEDVEVGTDNLSREEIHQTMKDIVDDQISRATDIEVGKEDVVEEEEEAEEEEGVDKTEGFWGEETDFQTMDEEEFEYTEMYEV